MTVWGHSLAGDPWIPEDLRVDSLVQLEELARTGDRRRLQAMGRLLDRHPIMGRIRAEARASAFGEDGR